MPQDVREITVERDENARFTRGDENGPNTVGDILVELDRSHNYADMETMLSRERSAAYASAAAIASLGKLG